MGTEQKRTVFVGTFRHSIDDKKRTSIPAKWRAGSDVQDFYVLPLPKGHLLVLPDAAMGKMLEKVDQMQLGEYERSDVLREIIGASHAAQVDSNGRISLTDDLMKHAGITEEAVLVGVLKGFEIWSADRLAVVKQSIAPNLAEMTKKLGL